MITRLASICRNASCYGINSRLPAKLGLTLRIKNSIPGTTCRPVPSMQRRGDPNRAHASQGDDKAPEAPPGIPSGMDFAWFQCGCWLVAGAFLPSLLTCCFYKEVTELYHFMRVAGLSFRGRKVLRGKPLCT